jgi:hypothetical protein
MLLNCRFSFAPVDVCFSFTISILVQCSPMVIYLPWVLLKWHFLGCLPVVSSSLMQSPTCVLFSVTGSDSMTATDCTNSSSRSREWWSCIVHDTSRTSGYPPWVPQDVGGSKAPVVIVELKVSFVFLCVSVSVCLFTVVIRATTTSTVLSIQSLLTLWAINWMFISSVVKSLPHTMLATYMCNLLHVFLVQFL